MYPGPSYLGSEDFAFMLQKKKGTYCLLGNGDTAMVHHPQYVFDDAILPMGAAYWVTLTERYLQKPRSREIWSPQHSVAVPCMPLPIPLLSGCGLHALSTTREGNTGVPALTEHDGFDQGLIHGRGPIPANQEIGSGSTGGIGPLDHKSA